MQNPSPLTAVKRIGIIKTRKGEAGKRSALKCNQKMTAQLELGGHF